MKHTILIDLDVILDTRIATIMAIDASEGLKMLQRGFCRRTSDDISELTSVISNDVYQKAYANRNVETLQNARLSSYIFELTDMVENLTRTISRDDGRIDDANIVINYYPYENLDEEELAQIVYAVETYTSSAVTIQVAYYKPSDLDLKALKAMDILTYVTYGFKEWFESVFNVNKGKSSIVAYPKLTVIAPMILPKKDAFDFLDANSKKILQNKSPFDFMKLYWAPMFGLEFCPIELMSLIDTALLGD